MFLKLVIGIYYGIFHGSRLMVFRGVIGVFEINFPILKTKFTRAKIMAARGTRDLDIAELDVVQEIDGHAVARKNEVRLPEIPESQVRFFQCFLMIVECFVPMCRGHRKFGVTTETNIPVIFRYHDPSKEAIYCPFKNPLNMPLRVPATGNIVLGGIYWKLTDGYSKSRVIPSVFDCLIANLRYQMMLTQEFCLECLLTHMNGMGLHLERLLKTVLYHVVPFGRKSDEKPYKTIDKMDETLDLRFKRIWWGKTTDFLWLTCNDFFEGMTEKTFFRVMEPTIYLPNSQSKGVRIESNGGILRNLDSISRITVSLRCSCESGRTRFKTVYIGLLQKAKRNTIYNISLAQWKTRGEEYEDPIWFWSLYGADRVSVIVKESCAIPITELCKKCNDQITIRDVRVPETTWLFMADLAEPLKKKSLAGLNNIETYSIGGVTFKLAFVLLYNTETGAFTSMNYNKSQWKFFDDAGGGIYQYSNPNRVKYRNRINVRAFYYRVTETEPHRCLAAAVSRF